MSKSRIFLVAAILLSVVAMSALGLAAIPDEDGVIHACYDTSRGNMRVVDDPCAYAGSEQPLSWNQQGPPGPPGSDGADGEPGASGFEKVARSFSIDTGQEAGGFSGFGLAVCPSGKVATGGGYAVNVPANAFPTLSVAANAPFDGPAGSGWFVGIIASQELTAEVHAVCVNAS